MSGIGAARVQPALHAILEHDPAALQDAIDADRGIVAEVWDGNTLLEWLTQPPHQIDDEIVAVLIAAGSPLDRALNLAGCWNLDRLCTQLLAAGGNPAARADADITPLESAVMHGSTKSADVLVTHGLHRRSFWLAAATGQLDLVRDWLNPNGELVQYAGTYRPNLADVGHPQARSTTDDPTEIVDEALVFAGANNRMDVVDYLVSTGTDINARPYLNTTALHLAIMFSNPDAVAGLLERGSATDIEDDHHHSDAAGWAQACLNDNPDSQRVAELIGIP